MMGEEQLRLPLDGGGFFRRECPDCHGQFKLRWTDLDGRLLLRQIGSVIPFANEEELVDTGMLSCPYCAHREDARAWWTEEQRSHLTERAAALRAEIRFEQLRYVERSLAENPFPTFLPVAPAPYRGAFAPEPDDMRAVPLVCCGEEVKVRDSWSEKVRCPFCGVETGIDPVGESAV